MRKLAALPGASQQVKVIKLFLSPTYQGSALSLTNAQYPPINFQTAYKMMSRLSLLAGHQDRKNPTLYNYIILMCKMTILQNR